MKHFRLSLILHTLFCVFLSATVTAQVNDFYVSPAGSDSGSGTQTSPWATINHAVAAFTLGSSGAVIHVAPGSYTSTSTCAGLGSTPVNVCLNRGGSSTSVRLVLQCDPATASATAAQGQCKISGAAGAGVAVFANNVDIVGFDIGNTAAMFSGIFIPYTGSSTTSSTGNSIHSIGNYVHDLASGASGPEGVGCPQTGAIEYSNQHGHFMSDAQIIGNFVARFAATPEAAPNCFNAHGMYINTGGATVENNIVVQATDGALQLLASACKNIISNNVLIHAKVGIILEDDAGSIECPGGPGLNTINNNIFGDMIAGGAVFYGGAARCTGGQPNFVGHNMTDGASPDFHDGPYSCDQVSPGSFDHETLSNVFVNYRTDGTGDYRMNTSSPASGAGTTTCVSGGPSPCAPSTDFAGNVRPSPLSIGAFDLSDPSALAAPTGLTAWVN